jgi:rhomboid protease GluP
MGWHVGYFDHDGIIAYTNISWESYSEEVSARVKDNAIVIKSECVGYQGLFTDYGKNKKNLDLLLGEIEYTDFHMQANLEQTTQELMDEIPEKQFLNPEDPPMAGKEQLRGFFSPFIPQKKYLVTHLLVILNILVFIVSRVIFIFLTVVLVHRHPGGASIDHIHEQLYLMLGFDSRAHVLNGEIWRLLTSVFQHFSLWHLFWNMAALVYIGSLLECKLGKWNYLLMFLFTGIIASMVSVLFNYSQISAGASGAIFGLFGILLALLSTNFYERSARRALLISTGIVVVYSIAPLGAGVDHAAHFGGLISGYVFGWIAFAGLNHQNLFIKKWGVALAGSAIVVVFVSCGLLFSEQYQVKEYASLMESADTLSSHLNAVFYGDDSTREEKLFKMEQKGLPDVQKLRKLAIDLTKLKLPRAKKYDAKMEAELIKLYCRYYPLLYFEFKDQNQFKYRPAIDSVTVQINVLRTKWMKSD